MNIRPLAPTSVRRHFSLRILMLAGIAAGGISNAAEPAQIGLSQNATDWLVKDICVDSQDRPVPMDPYFECPAGITRRKIQPGDPLPYYNFDQTGRQEGEAIPLLDARGNPLYIHAVEFAPFGEFHLNGAFQSDSMSSDGFDYYAVDSEWLSIPGTRDGGGMGQEFFGPNCRIGDGWVLYPIQDFLAGGHAKTEMAERYWEQSGMSYPGECPVRYGTPAFTFWELKRNMRFPGTHGNPPKVMDTIVSYHGFYKYGQRNHMEVFWFTQQYGLTMWQAWQPLLTREGRQIESNSLAPVSGVVNFQGVDFKIMGYRNWSNVKLADSPSIPEWPVPPANILLHSHFDDGGGYFTGGPSAPGMWRRAGKSAQGQIINWSLRNSNARRDTRFSPVGVRYLAMSSAGDPTGPKVQEISQELPINSIEPGGTYLFGVNARTESGQGQLQVTLQELDANNVVLWHDSVQGTIDNDNGFGAGPADASIYHTSAFIHKLTTIPSEPGAVKIRFYFTPLTPQIFDVLDACLNRFPAMKGPFGTAP